MKISVNTYNKPDPPEFDHVDDFTDDDFDEEEEMTKDKDCATTGGCMPDPEDFDD